MRWLCDAGRGAAFSFLKGRRGMLRSMLRNSSYIKRVFPSRAFLLASFPFAFSCGDTSPPDDQVEADAEGDKAEDEQNPATLEQVKVQTSIAACSKLEPLSKSSEVTRQTTDTFDLHASLAGGW